MRRGIFLLLVGLSASCSERAPATGIVSDFRVNFNYTVTSLDRSLTACELVWNGNSFGVIATSATGMQSSGVIPGVKVGVNTFAIRITSQTVSPSRYSVTGVVTATRADGAVQTFPVNLVGPALETGQLVSQIININP
ncbi:MAG: hypothetical protein Q8K82_16505 [Gemmatimonadaceae bacterium]|nr:hypothetical protein [Gemmatimonadaceae bacterium]